MALEIVGALAIAALVLWLVFEPLLVSPRPGLMIQEPDAAEETRRGVALIALKEIEFDRETGKLSDQDYEMLKERYGAEALSALAAEEVPLAPPVTGDPEELIAAQLQHLRSARSPESPSPRACPGCGPRPEPDALFCSSCGRRLGAASYCIGCGSPLPAGSRFCAVCGAGVGS
ncbi:MAG: zinc ribbon domain-containing protein [Actinomycetota bacterium]|nr:zinc ribbon domain-containing protein [Actinomycetota bacterium]